MMINPLKRNKFLSTTASLFLHPEPPDWFPEQPEQLIGQLNQLGLIAEAIETTETQFYAGEKFLDHISFMGCSPAISFEPGINNKNFCHLKLHLHKKIQFIHTTKQARAPHCPHCKKTNRQWQLQPDNQHWTCPHCQQAAAAWNYDWRHSAGFARVFLEITDIYPREALPQPALLSALQKHHGINWDYFYYCP
jgi:glutaredoxin